jgi:hypothetical protein
MRYTIEMTSDDMTKSHNDRFRDSSNMKSTT